MTLAAGSKLGPYEIVSLLGAGGMGEVYLAFDPRLRRKVAIKLLPVSLLSSAERVSRFEQEARAASALNHPNIVTVHEIGEASVGRYLVMELVDGKGLRDACLGPIDPLIVVGFARQAAKALAAAHAAGIVHRDIKPDNIMVRNDGYVKVLDFGLARLSAVNRETNDETLFMSQPGSLLGTPRYMSPEQSRSEELTDASDIFSLGIVLYEMLTGRYPFHGDGLLSILRAIVTDPVVPPATIRQEIPAELSSLILSMLAKAADARPAACIVDQALAAIERDRNLPETATASPKPVPRQHVIGRDRELEQLQAAFESATGRQGRIVCITGETGMGKTALVEEFLASAAQAGAVVGRGRCSERLASADAYLPLLEALESILRSDPVAQRIMSAVAPNWHAQIGLGSDSARNAEAKANSQERLKRELASFFRELASTRPIVLFFDDLHWADVSTVDILYYLAGKFGETKLLVVAAYRPSEIKLAKHAFLDVQPDLQAHGWCMDLPLERLTEANFSEWCSREFPGHRFPADFLAGIFAKTGGNPLFIADLIRYLRDREAVVLRDGHWVAAKPASDVAREVPESLRGLIQRKIDRLDEEDRKLLTAASLQGNEFDSAVLASVLQMDPADLEERLETLDRVYALVQFIEESEYPDHTPTLRYRFVQNLYQNVLYASLRPTRRSSLSAGIARVLAEKYAGNSGQIASQLALLYETAREFAKAADHYGMAAQNAGVVFASRESGWLARRGLEALQSLPSGTDRDSREIELQLQLGNALTVTRGYGNPETGACFARALELSSTLGEPRHLFPTLLGVWFYYLVSGECRKGLELAERLGKVAEAQSDVMSTVAASYALSQTLEITGDLGKARVHAESGVAAYNPADHRTYCAQYGFDPGLYVLSDAARIAWLMGYPEQARRRIQEALRHYRQADPRSQSMVLTIASLLHQFLGEPQEALERSTECVAICDRYDVPQEREWSNFVRGWAMGALGQLDEGIRIMRESQAALGELHSIVIIGTHYAALFAETLTEAGRLEEATLVIDGALKFAARTGDRHYEPELHRLRGELLLRNQSDRVAAENCFRQAIGLARTQGARSWELRAAMSLSELLAGRSDLQGAADVLSPVYARFAEGLDTRDLRRASEVLNKVRKKLPKT